MPVDLIDFGKQIDRAFDSGDAAGLKTLIDHGASLEQSPNLNPDSRAVLLYFLGNAWSDLDILERRGTERDWYYNRAGHINAIKYFRKAVLTPDVTARVRKGIFAQAFTNLGNMFSEAGRIIYALEAWRKALEVLPGFGMAGCNLSHGLLSYSRFFHDDYHSALVLRYAYKNLKVYIRHKDIYPKALQAFKADVEHIEHTLSKDFLRGENRFRKYSLGSTKAEQAYRTWCLSRGLFLNPLNDLFRDSAIAHDVLSLPSMALREYSAPVFYGFFNELKQGYISARYNLYLYEKGLPEHKVHFSDKGSHLIDTLDYPQHGLRHECLRNAFRVTYSLFDKIGYFLNEYFHLSIDRNKVYFRRLWFDNAGNVRTEIQSLQNLPLRGLYYLSKDFYDSDLEWTAVADPEARDIAEIRNHMEHKYLKIHWIGPLPPSAKGDVSYDELAFSVRELDLAEKTFRLIKSAREALIYLSAAVHANERNERKEGELAVPLTLFGYDGWS
jgi:hypothetical protein